MLLEFTADPSVYVEGAGFAINPLDVVVIRRNPEARGCVIYVRGLPEFHADDEYEDVLKRVNDASIIH